MDEPEETAEERAERRRRTWTIRKVAVDSAMQASETTVAERVAAMYWLVETWLAMSGATWPDYARAEIPGRVLRPGGSCPDP